MSLELGGVKISIDLETSENLVVILQSKKLVQQNLSTNLSSNQNNIKVRAEEELLKLINVLINEYKSFEDKLNSGNIDGDLIKKLNGRLGIYMIVFRKSNYLKSTNRLLNRRLSLLGNWCKIVKPLVGKYNASTNLSSYLQEKLKVSGSHI